MKANLGFEQFAGMYCHAKTYQSVKIEIHAPWGIACNMDDHTIPDFTLLVDLASRKGWKVTVEA